MTDAVNTATGMVVFNSTVQDVVPEEVRGRVFTLLDVTWNAMRLLSLGLGGLLVDAIGIQALFWAGGSLLTLAGLLGVQRQLECGGAWRHGRSYFDPDIASRVM